MRKTKEQRRLAIIDDAIKQLTIEEGIFKAVTGYYLQIPSAEFRAKMYDPRNWGWKETSMKDVLCEAPAKSCEICAQGGIFLSFIRLENKISVAQAMNVRWDTAKLAEYVKVLFDKNQMLLIEQYYEMWNTDTREKNKMYKKEIYNWFRQQKKLFDSNTSDSRIRNANALRLLAILHNMKKNKGIFIP
jgi:hypothetical protein